MQDSAFPSFEVTVLISGLGSLRHMPRPWLSEESLFPLQPKNQVVGIGFPLFLQLSYRSVFVPPHNSICIVFRPPARRSWEDDQGEGGGGDGEGKGSFPPGEHPLEGVPNLADLAAPEALSAKVDLSEVGFLQLLRFVARCNYCYRLTFAGRESCADKFSWCWHERGRWIFSRVRTTKIVTLGLLLSLHRAIARLPYRQDSGADLS